MNTNLFDVKYRIFKRERVREGKNNLVIVPKKDKIIKKNQIEFVWTNTGLEDQHLSILGIAMVNEWERVLPEIVISRAFIQKKENDKLRLYISFQAEDSLTNDEIKEVILKSLTALNRCLEKITKRVIGDLEFEQFLLKKEKIARNKSKDEDFSPELKEDELIQKLHSEIMLQEELLSKLEQQQKEQESTNQKNVAFENQSMGTFEKSTETIDRLYGEINRLEKTIDLLTKELILTNESKRDLENNSFLLKNELEIVKKKQVESNESIQKVTSLEKDNQELKKENSDYRIKLIESQSLIDQYIKKNNYLTETYEKVEREKKEFIKHAQAENKEIHEALNESEKKLKLLTNHYQKDSENLQQLRKQLVETKVDSEEKIRKFNAHLTELKEENKKLKSVANELEVSKSRVNQLEQDLKLAETTIDVINERKEKVTVNVEDSSQIEVWQKKYEKLLENYSELERDGFNYRQEIAFLNSQIISIEDKCNEIVSNDDNEFVELEEKKTDDKNDKIFEELVFSIDADDDYYDFSYEPDPYVKRVEAMELDMFPPNDQIQEQELIYDLFDTKAITESREIKVKKNEYKKYVSDVKFLSYRWSQLTNRDTVDINTEFLKWCDPLIEQIDFFEEDLEDNVKKAFLTKNYVIMKESVYHMLKGYSRIYMYLNTYCILS